MNDPKAVADPTKTHMSSELKHNRPLITCRFDPTGRFVFATAEDNSIQRWELATGKQTALAGHQSWPRGVAFSPKGETLITGAYDGKVIWWPAADEAPKPIRTIQAHNGWVRWLAVSPDGQWLASAGNDNLVKVWSLADGSLKWQLAGHARHVYAVAFHPDGKSLVSGDLKGVIKQWDLATGKPTRDMDAAVLWKYDGGFHADIGGLRGIDVSADGSMLACSGITNVSNAFAGVGNPMVVVIDWAAGKEKKKLVPAAAFQGVGWGVAFHRAGFVIGAGGGGSGGGLWFWKPEEEKSFHFLQLPAIARDMCLHPDGLRIAVAHHDSILRVYTMAAKA